MKPVVWITGAGGLVGSYLMRTASRWALDWDARGLTRQDVDLTDETAVRRLWQEHQPTAVIHCAAISRPAVCEQDPELATKINVGATALLASLASEVPLLFFSSDQVFDGRQGWYVETDRINPINRYGETKAVAEKIVLSNPRHTVIRLALTAGTSATGDRSFVEDMRRSAGQGHDLTLFTDEFRCPVPAAVVARAVWELIGLKRSGLYHLGGAERLSRMEIGEALAMKYPELASRLQPGSVTAYRGPQRPPDLSMCCDKIQRLLSFPIPGLRSWLMTSTTPGTEVWDYPLTSSRVCS
ncbi:SDR family oxidoreductase [Nitrospira lenta]|uniref:dTDP-4-dehydrorhamnose reductase n=1 Tax=Nitrospira lenta TaxID=1436998 RepID=A0A330L6J5_9BACT|nr:SDR family oxidoreductase [Nitrospira lenta]SPP64565.1 putative dTDP-4-dehydrorhamnose reductase [Nitrospira lenta]